MEKFGLSGYSLIEVNEGHSVFNKKGLRNPYKIFEKDGNKKVLMEVNKKNEENIEFLFDYIDLDNVLFDSEGKFRTWFCSSNNHVQTITSNKQYIYIHQLVMYMINPEEFLTESVYHIDLNPLNNLRNNLTLERYVKSGQVKIEKKRARKKNAKELPSALNGIELPKYVTYNFENYKTASGVSRREYFRIEKHPLQVKGVVKDKKKTTSKQSVNILDKLEEAKQIIKTFDEQLNNL